jgi:hypothetical protein
MERNYQMLDHYAGQHHNHTSPTASEKMDLIKKLEELPTKYHLDIFFHNIFNLHNNNLYTINNNSTLLDLNDLPNDKFWILKFNIELSYNDFIKAKINKNVNTEIDNHNSKISDYINDEISRSNKLKTFSLILNNNKDDHHVEIKENIGTQEDKNICLRSATCIKTINTNNNMYSNIHKV